MSRRTGDSPAFPTEETSAYSAFDGMTLRQWYAGQAISLFSLSAEEIRQIKNGSIPNHDSVARFCLSLADAIVRESQERE